jgi:uncharacterized protein YggE
MVHARTAFSTDVGPDLPSPTQSRRIPNRPRGRREVSIGLTFPIEIRAARRPRRHSGMIGGLLVVVLVGALAHPAGPAAATEATPAAAVLTVTAAGRIEAVPDVGVLDAGVLAERPTAAAALAAANTAVEAFRAATAAAGIAPADVATTRFALTPVWTGRTESDRRITAYRAENGLTVRVRRVADLGPLVERIVAGGNNTISGIGFEVSDLEQKRDAARVAAVETAVARAERLARAAGQRIVRLKSLTSGDVDGSLPMMRRAAPTTTAGVPLEAGSETITAEVTATFEVAPLGTP